MSKEQKNTDGCTDDECKTCDNIACPESPKYEEREPSVLKFMVQHSLSTAQYMFDGVVGILRSIWILISAPWGIPYAGLVYNEMQQIYFENVKKKNIPYFSPTSFMMQDAIIGVARNKKIRKTITSRIRANNSGIIAFYIKMFLAPFHYTHKCVKEKTAFARETMKYNDTIKDKYQTEDGKLDNEKMGKVTMEIMELFASTFINIKKEQPDEES